MLAFIRGGSGTFTTEGQIYLKMLPGGVAVPLTQDTLSKMAPVFFAGRDADRVHGQQSTDTPWETWTRAGAARRTPRWLRNASGLTWVDGDHLLFSEIKKGQHMGIVTSTESRADARDVYVPAMSSQWPTARISSPDGKLALIVEMDAGRRLAAAAGLFHWPAAQAGHRPRERAVHERRLVPRRQVGLPEREPRRWISHLAGTRCPTPRPNS